MEKTSEQIIDALSAELLAGPLFTDADKVGGKLYRGDGLTSTRPRDSRAEDVVVTWTAGYSGQVSNGIITVNIFCPDIRPFRDKGQHCSNVARLSRLQDLARTAVEGLSQNPIKYTLDEAIHTSADVEIEQHFVVVRLAYRYINL